MANDVSSKLKGPLAPRRGNVALRRGSVVLGAKPDIDPGLKLALCLVIDLVGVSSS